MEQNIDETNSDSQYFIESAQWQRRNFYTHHHMPARLIKTTQKNTSGKRNSIVNVHLGNINQYQQPAMQFVGRNLFPQTSKNIPGPGFYQETIQKSNSFGYIKKEQNFVLAKIEKKIKKKALILSKRGPGTYNLSDGFEKLSRSKTASLGKMSSVNFERTIIPSKTIENIYLNSEATAKRQRKQQTPGPTSYSLSKQALLMTSNFSKPQINTISQTKRSNIVNQNLLPGPGFYSWEKYFEKKVGLNKEKPVISFKFVYGHPS